MFKAVSKIVSDRDFWITAGLIFVLFAVLAGFGVTPTTAAAQGQQLINSRAEG